MDKKYVDEIKANLDAGFNPIESCENIINQFDTLCQIMFDPENQPPQYSRDEAWEIYRHFATGKNLLMEKK